MTYAQRHYKDFPINYPAIFILQDDETQIECCFQSKLLLSQLNFLDPATEAIEG